MDEGGSSRSEPTCLSDGLSDSPGLPRLSRRTTLVAGAAGAVAAGATAVAVATGLLSPATLVRSLGASGVSPATAGAVVRTEWLYSAARGRHVELITMLPAATKAAGLPVCVGLHGLHGSARAVAAGGLAGFLAAAVANGQVPPFAVVAVDGGDSYWHEHTRGDDPMAMLIYELPRWLAERGLQRLPFAATGVSMGGFGTLHYASRRAQQARPLLAVAAIAPALITTWTEMRKRNAFHNAADWASYDPLRNLDALGEVPIGIWCGNEDKFIAGVRRFIATGRAEVSAISPGGHDDRYFRRALPEAVRFIGRHVG